MRRRRCSRIFSLSAADGFACVARHPWQTVLNISNEGNHIMNDPMGGMNPPQSNGMAIAALVIGIGSMVLAIIPVIGFLSWILSPLAIILGAIALRKTVGKGLAIGGIITGVIGVLICIAWVALFGAALNSMPAGTMEEIQAEVEKANQQSNGMTPQERGMAAVEEAVSSTSGGSAGTGAGAGAGSPTGDYSANPAGGTSSGDYSASPAGGTRSGDYSASPAGGATATGASDSK
jgi:hypothetical protein